MPYRRKAYGRYRKRRRFKKRSFRKFPRYSRYRRRRYTRYKLRSRFAKRRYSGKRRSRRGTKRQPLFYRNVQGQVLELHANGITNRIQQKWFLDDTFAILRFSQLTNVVNSFITNTQLTQAGPTTVTTALRDLKLWVSKVYGSIDFTSQGSFPTWVDVYIVRPRTDIPQGDIPDWDSVATATYNNTTAVQSELANAAAGLDPTSQDIGYTPYHFPEFTARFKAKRIFSQLMQPGASAKIPYKTKGFMVDKRLATIMAAGQIGIWKKSFCFMFHCRTPVLSCLATTSGLESVSRGPFKLAVIKEEWWKMYSRYDEGYRVIMDTATTLTPDGNTINTGTFKWFNPDLSAPQTSQEA